MADTALKLVLLGQDRSASKTLRGVGNEAGRTGGKFAKLGGLAKGAGVGLLVAGAAAIKFGGDALLFDEGAVARRFSASASASGSRRARQHEAQAVVRGDLGNGSGNHGNSNGNRRRMRPSGSSAEAAWYGQGQDTQMQGVCAICCTIVSGEREGRGGGVRRTG